MRVPREHCMGWMRPAAPFHNDAIFSSARAFGTRMGIKFYCPNGHKLNVKSFLAGKRAICPKCGVKVVVPGEATDSESALEPDEFGELETAEAGGIGKRDRSSLSAASTGHPSSPLAAAAVDAAVGASSNDSPASGSAGVDPIDEDPTAVWYVRPP